jgi:hypothetical protein
MAMVAVGGDVMVIRTTERGGSHGDGFLTDVKMEESGHFTAIVESQCLLFESADSDHLGEEFDLPLRCERLIDGRKGEIEGGGAGAGHGGVVGNQGRKNREGRNLGSANLGKCRSGCWGTGEFRKAEAGNQKHPVKSRFAAVRLRRKTHDGNLAAMAGPAQTDW